MSDLAIYSKLNIPPMPTVPLYNRLAAYPILGTPMGIIRVIYGLAKALIGLFIAAFQRSFAVSKDGLLHVGRGIAEICSLVTFPLLFKRNSQDADRLRQRHPDSWPIGGESGTPRGMSSGLAFQSTSRPRSHSVGGHDSDTAVCVEVMNSLLSKVDSRTLPIEWPKDQAKPISSVDLLKCAETFRPDLLLAVDIPPVPSTVASVPQPVQDCSDPLRSLRQQEADLEAAAQGRVDTAV